MTANVRATVVIPTHDHGPTLVHSVGSAMAQTVDALEIFVVGDGVPDETRDVMADLCHSDKRVRFFDNPKGPRHGEVHRHAALAEARGRIVCYLCDDDLWLPHHVETLEETLVDAEFGNTLAASIQPDQSFSSHVGDLSLSILRDHMLAGFNFVPLSCAGHLLTAYRELPYGWRTTPDGIWTDLYMWQQFLGRPTFRFRTSGEITVVHLQSVLRRSWSADERLAELETWALRLGDDRLQDELVRQAATYFRQESVRKLVSELQWQGRVAELEAEVGAEGAARVRTEEALSQMRTECAEAAQRMQSEIGVVAGALQAHLRRIGDLEARLSELGSSVDEAIAARTQAELELSRTQATVTWRLRERVLRPASVRLAVRSTRRMLGIAARRAR